MGVVFVGFMGTGKSTLARLLADRLGVPVCDVDTQIEAETGLSLAGAFETLGEVAFREIERQAIARIPAGYEGIVATGGGAWLDPLNRDRLLLLGPVIALDADPDVLWQRVRSSDRPLARDRESFFRLYDDRKAAYAAAPWQLTTGFDHPESLIDRLVPTLDGPAFELVAPFDGRDTHIRIAPGAIAQIGVWLARFREPGACTVVSEPSGSGRYLDLVRASLERAGWSPRLMGVPTGEVAKSWSAVTRLQEELARCGHERHQPLIALGGGALGDMVGFVAATFMRGVPFIQIPTTLLAQVDSSVGGKVAIDLEAGKNLVGAFWPADQVLIDPLVLASLEARDLSSGLAEVVKMAILTPGDGFASLARQVERLRARDASALVPAIHEAILRKAEIVARDPRESGERRWLNLGHTVGHACETVAGHGTWRHGEAVSVGLVAALHLASARGLVSSAWLDQIVSVLERLGLPVRIPGLSIDELLAVMGRDKKVEAGVIRFVLPRESDVPVLVSVQPEEIGCVLERLGAHR